jgi:hypothetical protein
MLRCKMDSADTCSEPSCLGLAAVGPVQEQFALMLHDRLVDLEHTVSKLVQAPLDPALRVLGASRSSDSSAAFVRVCSAVDVDMGDVCRAVLESLGALHGGTRFDAWSCQHWSCFLDATPYVLELAVQASGLPQCLDVATVGHAALDAVRAALRRLRRDRDVSAEACPIRCPAWFAESIRVASAASAGRAVLHTWDPLSRATTSADVTDSAEILDDPDTWLMLHGWLARQVELTEVWHPKAPSAAACAVQLATRLRAI